MIASEPARSALSEPDSVPSGADESLPSAASVSDPLVEGEQLVPPVVVVLVAHDPGSWFEDVLESIRQQTYRNLSVLVIDSSTGPLSAVDATVGIDGADPATNNVEGSARADSVTDHLARILPAAHVHRVDHDLGYGPAANEAIGAIEGATFLLFCHDDVVFDAMAVQAMVEEAFRSNAGIVGPKIVSWDAPDRLVQVGMGADKFGVPSPQVERGELDQEQHDAVRDVFYVSGAAMLVRADLFETLGGFDPGIDFIGEDLDLCWRAHVAGARVLVAPAAKIAHRESFDDRRAPRERRRRAFRHRLRSQLTCYGAFHRIRVVPQAFVLAVIETIASVFLGRLGHARDVASAWTTNLGDRRSIKERRRMLKAVRTVPDRDIRVLQVRGSAAASAFFRGQFGANDDRLTTMAGAGRSLAESLRSATARASIAAWMLVLVIFAFGSRELLTAPIPAVGEFTVFPDQPVDLLRQWVSGYHAAGLGSETANPTAFGFLGGLGVAAFGAMGQLRRILILALLPAGALGMWRLARPIGSRRSRIVALVVYAATPVMSNAMAAGSWSGLVLYALAPWIINQLARASRLAPFGPVGDEAGPGVVERPLLQRILLLGVMTAFGAMLVPSVIPVVLVTAVAMAIGGMIVGQFRGVLRLMAVALGAVVVAAALHLPWSIDLVTRSWSSTISVGTLAPSSSGFADILRFDTGHHPVSVLSWAFLAVAALPLLIGRRWRLAWAMRGWAIALVGWGLVFAAAQGWIGPYLPAVDVVLAPAAAGLALASAMGMASFEVDLGDYHFGWRQIASVFAGAALVASIVPFLQVSTEGSWNLPRGDFNQVLSTLESPSGSFRTLWIGDASLVPFQAWPLGIDAIEQPGDPGRLVYGTTTGRTPDVTDLLTGSDAGATRELHATIDLAAHGQTNRLGALLAPMGVEFIVVPQRTSTATTARPGPPTPALLDVLSGQLDLARVQFPTGIVVYRNAAWGPVTARLPRDVVLPTGDAPTILDRTIPELSGAPDALPSSSGFAAGTGVVPDPATVYLGSVASDRWSLRVNGQPQQREDVLGWANAYRVDATGQADLQFQTSRKRYLALAGEALLWLAALSILWRTRVRRETERDLVNVRQARDL